MGLEYITQPQVFLQPITAVGGIQTGLIDNMYPPLYTSFFTWTSTSSVSASVFPLTGIQTLTNRAGSYIVTVGGVIQSPENYVVNPNFRSITFDFAVNPDTPVVVTQIGTIAVSSSNLTSLTATNSLFFNSTFNNVTANNLYISDTISTSATNINFLSARRIDLVHPVAGDGANAVLNLGEIDVNGLKGISTFYDESSNRFILASRNGVTTLTSVAIDIRTGQTGIFGLPLSGQALTVAGNLSALGTVTADALSAREINLVHFPANDGIDPMFNIGETDTAGFSGIRVRYEEPSNRLIVSSRTGTTVLTSAIINVQTGQVGISGLPALGQALTITGNVSASGNIVGANTDTYYVLSGIRAITTSPSAAFFDPTIAISLLANRQYTLHYDLYHAKDATAGSILFGLSTTNSSLTAAVIFTHLANIGAAAQPVMAGVVSRVGPIITLPPLATITANTSSFTQINATLELGATPATLLLAVSSAAGNLNALRGSKRVLTLLN